MVIMLIADMHTKTLVFVNEREITDKLIRKHKSVAGKD